MSDWLVKCLSLLALCNLVLQLAQRLAVSYNGVRVYACFHANLPSVRGVIEPSRLLCTLLIYGT